MTEITQICVIFVAQATAAAFDLSEARPRLISATTSFPLELLARDHGLRSWCPVRTRLERRVEPDQRHAHCPIAVGQSALKPAGGEALK
jgi:hypothetical protein